MSSVPTAGLTIVDGWRLTDEALESGTDGRREGTDQHHPRTRPTQQRCHTANAPAKPEVAMGKKSKY